ncbi:unnamed protein product [Durusdinium trenchii]|uniref:Adenylate cyclase n=1 Tax=Durusdinium trenchii TaxID=1381693 RepID=A0ABP0HJU7_9DINO
MESVQDPQDPFAVLSEEDKSFLVCVVALVLLALGITLRATRHHWSHPSLTFCKCYERLRHLRNKEGEDLRWNTYLLQEVCEQKVVLARIYGRYAACVLIFSSLIRVQRMLSRDPPWLSSEGAWFGLVVAFLATLMSQVPQATQRYSLDVICFLWYLVAAFHLSSWVVAVEQLLLMELLMFMIVHIPVCTFAKHYSVILLCQGGIMAFVVARAMMEDLQRIQITNKSSMVVFNILLLGYALLVHSLSNSFLQQTVELRVRGADSKTQGNATSSLLELTCDAVVHLDSELRITSDARDALAAMLFRNPEALRGTKFTELIATAEARSRAAEILNEEAEARAHAFHTQLVDGCFTRFRTEVFQVKYSKMNGEKCHLLGLRDFTDVKPLSQHATDAASPVEREVVDGSSQALRIKLDDCHLAAILPTLRLQRIQSTRRNAQKPLCFFFLVLAKSK